MLIGRIIIIPAELPLLCFEPFEDAATDTFEQATTTLPTKHSLSDYMLHDR